MNGMVKEFVVGVVLEDRDFLLPFGVETMNFSALGIQNCPIASKYWIWASNPVTRNASNASIPFM